MKWTREHEIVTLDLYCNIPFQKANNSNKDIQRLAEVLKRSVNSVKMKIGNFGSFDPELKRLGIGGLGGTSRLDEDVWNEYYGHWDKLAFDAKQILAHLNNNTIEEEADIDLRSLPQGREKERIVKQRINQTFFRNAVLSSYSNRCCITGIAEPHLLEAAHIMSWADDEQNRTNPSNGLCMNALMHRAYDNMLMSVSPDFIICFSEKLLDEESVNERQIEFFSAVNGHQIIKPNRFLPDRNFLAQHYEKFIKN
ncbi:MAG: HNH endonuclease [Bacteroidaceae bacterium]|nr:HNH endonuclease [Bacteroidaceae bacterium]